MGCSFVGCVRLRFQAHELGHFHIARQQARCPARVVLFEPASELWIKRVQGLDFGKAHAIGWVGNKNAVCAVWAGVLRV